MDMCACSSPVWDRQEQIYRQVLREQVALASPSVTLVYSGLQIEVKGRFLANDRENNVRLTYCSMRLRRGRLSLAWLQSAICNLNS